MRLLYLLLVEAVTTKRWSRSCGQFSVTSHRPILSTDLLHRPTQLARLCSCEHVYVNGTLLATIRVLQFLNWSSSRTPVGATAVWTLPLVCTCSQLGFSSVQFMRRKRGFTQRAGEERQTTSTTMTIKLRLFSCRRSCRYWTYAAGQMLWSSWLTEWTSEGKNEEMNE